MNIRPQTRAFTLLELLVTITLILILIGGGLFYLDTSKGTQELRSNAGQIRSLLLEARSEAVAARKTVSVSVSKEQQQIEVFTLEPLARWDFETRENGQFTGEQGHRLQGSQQVRQVQGHTGQALFIPAHQTVETNKFRVPEGIQGLDVEFWMYQPGKGSKRLFHVPETFELFVTQEQSLGISVGDERSILDQQIPSHQWTLIRLAFFQNQLHLFVNDQQRAAVQSRYESPSGLLQDRTLSIGGDKQNGDLLIDSLQITAIASRKHETISFSPPLSLDTSTTIQFFEDGQSSGGTIQLTHKDAQQQTTLELYSSGFVHVQDSN